MNYCIRVATNSHADRIFSFYRQNRFLHVEVRHEDIILQQINQGSVHILVESSGEICGCSASYDLLGREYAELGSTIILRPIRLPLYELMISVQTIHQLLNRPPRREVIVNVDITHPSIIRRLTHNLGFERTYPKAEIVQGNLATVELRHQEILWLRCPLRALIAHSGRILEHLVSSTVRWRDGPEIAVQLDSPSHTQLELRAIVDLFQDRNYLTIANKFDGQWQLAATQLALHQPSLGMSEKQV